MVVLRYYIEIESKYSIAKLRMLNSMVIQTSKRLILVIKMGTYIPLLGLEEMQRSFINQL